MSNRFTSLTFRARKKPVTMFKSKGITQSKKEFSNPIAKYEINRTKLHPIPTYNVMVKTTKTVLLLYAFKTKNALINLQKNEPSEMTLTEMLMSCSLRLITISKT